jgi:hypothetical protein
MRYRSASISADGAADDGAAWEDPHSPSGRPGFRMPSVALRHDGAAASTVDLIGTAPVLFTGCCSPARTAARGRRPQRRRPRGSGCR